MALRKQQTKTVIFEALDVLSGTGLKASSGVLLLIMKILEKI
jgi:hypothetical protein